MARFYVTTPIFYPNDIPHLGTAYTAVNADAMARWHRLIGDDVFFLTGTDEHGAKIAEAAAEHGVSPQEWTDQIVVRFTDAWATLDLSNDDFIRTTEPRHHATVQAFLQRIYDNGFIEPGTYTGLYCVSCEDYYTEDQLVDGRCPIHGRPVVEMEERNYFFKLSRFQQPLLDWYEQHPDAVRPLTKRNEALGFIKGGLRDISITRTSFSWGVPVPWDEDHVFYVWYDALINYLTAIGYGEDEDRFAAWWPAVHHLVGKDILKFHCVWWPAMCLAAGIDPPAHVMVHGFLLVGGQKLSKSALGADGDRPVRATDIAPETLTGDFGVDAIRYHLLREVPLGADGEFSYEGLVARYNADLANNLGNLVARVATVVGSKCGGVGPAADPDSPLAAAAASALAGAQAAWDRFAPHEALEAAWRLIGAANAELEATEPWKAEPGPEVDAVLGSALEALRIISLLVVPAIPATAQEIWRRIGLTGSPADQRLPAAAGWGGYPGGAEVEKGAPLFPPSPGLVVADASAPGPGWFDSHCHLQDTYRTDGPGGEGPESVGAALDRSAQAGVTAMVCVGTDPITSAQALALARASRSGQLDPGAPPVWATLGLHPHEASLGSDSVVPLIEEAVTRGDGAVVAVGECGLDYFYEHSPRAEQRRAFAEQIGLAQRFDLALVIHARDAWDDLFAVLGSEGVPERTVLHCFTGGPAELDRCLEAQMFVSFSGIVTFKNAVDVRQAAVRCPLDRLLVETDSPFLAPVPHRGRPNEPAYVALVGAAVADVKAIEPGALAESSSAAARRAFGL